VRTAAGLVAGAFAVLLALAAFGAAVGREQAVGAAAFGLAGALSLDLLHRVGDSVRGFFARRGLFRRAVIVAGEPAAASTIAQAITDSAAGVHVLGFVPRDPLAIGGPGPRLGGWDDIATLAADFRADAVLIAGSPDDLAQMAGGVAALRARAVPSAFVLEGSSELLQADAPDTLAGYPVLPLGAAGPVDALARGLGRLVAALALILSLPAVLPLLLLSALVFGGRPLVREPRVGLGGVRFSMWRLRTSPEAKAPTLSSWLRRLHLDEWPQLLNVLRGEMALVGPRPVADDVWATLFPWQQARAAARPGLTGMWQLDRLRRWRLPQMIASDLLYLLRWSPALDVRILLRTLLGRGSA
jgi:lipopolysaccharide/colanic/teichoic acid biosynthesis glycosyltransferase